MCKSAFRTYAFQAFTVSGFSSLAFAGAEANSTSTRNALIVIADRLIVTSWRKEATDVPTGKFLKPIELYGIFSYGSRDEIANRLAKSRN